MSIYNTETKEITHFKESRSLMFSKIIYGTNEIIILTGEGKSVISLDTLEVTTTKNDEPYFFPSSYTYDGISFLTAELTRAENGQSLLLGYTDSKDSPVISCLGSGFVIWDVSEQFVLFEGSYEKNLNDEKSRIYIAKWN